MEPRKNSETSGDKSEKKRGSHRLLKTAGVLAVVGAAAYAVAKGRKTARGRALEKKVRTKGRKVVRTAKRALKTSTARGTRKAASRAR